MSGLVASVLVLARGVAQELPSKYEASKEELAAARGVSVHELMTRGDDDDELADVQSDDAAQTDGVDEADVDNNDADEGDAMDTDDPFNMAHYDDEPDDAALHQALSNVAVGKDPYLRDAATVNADELDDVLLTKDDVLLLAACSEDDELSHLDVYVYERANDNLYVHHDYMLPAFPLALAWLDFAVGSERADEPRRENLVAVATFEPYIEIWDLDTYDQPAPLAVLGGPEDDANFGKKLTKKLLRSDSHTDAVLGLAWNAQQRNLLASASADGSVKLWDLSTGACLRTLRHHGGAKVQSVAWNPSEPALLATAAYDKQAAVLDVRAPDTAVAFARLDADAEALLWRAPPNHAQLLVATESGAVHCFDATKGLKTPLWSMRAHHKPTHALALSRAWGGALLATGSDDRAAPLKLWLIRDDGQAPSLVWEGGAEVGPVFSLSFSVDEPFLLVAGVQGDRPAIIDLLRVDVIAQRNAKWTGDAPQTTSTQATMAPGTLSSAISAAAPAQPSNAATSSSGNSSNNSAKKNSKKGKGKGR